MSSQPRPLTRTTTRQAGVNSRTGGVLGCSYRGLFPSMAGALTEFSTYQNHQGGLVVPSRFPFELRKLPHPRSPHSFFRSTCWSFHDRVTKTCDFWPKVFRECDNIS